MMESKENKMPQNQAQTTQVSEKRPNEVGGFHFESLIVTGKQAKNRQTERHSMSNNMR